MWFPLFIEPVAEKMGFKTFKAKMYRKRAADHHKSWEMVQVTLENMLLDVGGFCDNELLTSFRLSLSQ